MIAEASRTDRSSQADPKASRGIPRVGRRPVGATWVTRSSVHVDRIASAWLIRRFIDARARFKFVKPVGYIRVGKELRFDMYDAEFTHVGGLCTFEVLIRAFKLGRDEEGIYRTLKHHQRSPSARLRLGLRHARLCPDHR